MSSTKERMTLAQARAFANELVDLLKPHCKRIEIAGSIRRERHDIGDIEIVAQTEAMENDELDLRIEELCKREMIAPILRHDGKPEGWSTRLKKINYKGKHVDLFIVRPDRNWGITFLIRTGPGDANAWLVTRRRNGVQGGTPHHLLWRDGSIYRLPHEAHYHLESVPPGAVALDLPEEADVYAALGLPYIEPHDRCIANYKEAAQTPLPAPPLRIPTGSVTLATSRISIRDEDALDITVGAIEQGRATPHGIALSPTRDIVALLKEGVITEEEYRTRYLSIVRWRYATYPQVFLDILSRPRTVLTCYCAAGEFCHRHLALDILTKIAAKHGIPVDVEGEIAVQHTEPEPAGVTQPALFDLPPVPQKSIAAARYD